MKKTMYQKIWDAHVVHEKEGETPLLYVDRHLMHEVTSPQAFEGLRITGRQVHRTDSILATMDHCVPTIDRDKPLPDPIGQKQIETMASNCASNGLRLYDMQSDKTGVIHIIAPERGFIYPGMVVVCGDSHTATHGAFGALAFGIGTSEVEHVMATQTLQQAKAKTMLIRVDGELAADATAKDIALAIIGKIGTAGGTGHVIEFTGAAITALTMEGRMTLCNMAIEAGARAGMIAPDEITFEYLQGKEFAPAGEQWEQAVTHWRGLVSDEGAEFDATITMSAADIAPQVTWGTSPGQVIAVDQPIPDPAEIGNPDERAACESALAYMGLQGGAMLSEVPIDTVFIGSCTNGRIEDIRVAAATAKGKKVAAGIRAMVVPGSYPVKRQAEAEGLDNILLEAGFEWREPGCSMCLAMNGDQLSEGERSASTSNRNFEGRQGKGGRTHLVSPAMAAAAAIAGRFVDIRDMSRD